MSRLSKNTFKGAIVSGFLAGIIVIISYGIPSLLNPYVDPFEEITHQGSSNARAVTESIASQISGYRIAESLSEWTIVASITSIVFAIICLSISQVSLSSKPQKFTMKLLLIFGFLSSPTLLVFLNSGNGIYFYSWFVFTFGIGLSSYAFRLIATQSKHDLGPNSLTNSE